MSTELPASNIVEEIQRLQCRVSTLERAGRLTRAPIGEGGLRVLDSGWSRSRAGSSS